jgi:hypothetical protein
MSPSWHACSSKRVRQAPEVKPMLEVNPEHALVKKLDGSAFRRPGTHPV